MNSGAVPITHRISIAPRSPCAGWVVYSPPFHTGSVVIASHAASFALSGEGVLRVLVTASAATRAQRLSSTKNVDSRAAERLVKQEDAGRADYLKRFYAIERELPTHFDLVVNTDVLTPERAADVVVAAAGR